jgi:hypothetical protein
MGFDRADLLSQAQFSEGDILPVFSQNANASLSVSTTSTSYTDLTQLLNIRYDLNDLFDDDAAVYGRAGGSLIPGTGETQDFRVQNIDAGVTLAEIEGVASLTKFTTGWQRFDHTQFTGVNTIRAQTRTSPGTDSSTVSVPTLFVGVEL